MKRPVARLGMMFAAEPFEDDAVDEIADANCCRRRRSPLGRLSNASSAFTPTQGRAAACALFLRMSRRSDRPRDRVRRVVRGEGVHHHRGVDVIEVAGVDEVNLAPAPSLTEVPSRVTVNVQFVGDRAETDGAPRDDAAMML